MNQLAAIIQRHRPAYDGFDQNIDSWYCSCDGIRHYRSKGAVEEAHLVPAIQEWIKDTVNSESQKDRINNSSSLIHSATTAAPHSIYFAYNQILEAAKELAKVAIYLNQKVEEITDAR